MSSSSQILIVEDEAEMALFLKQRLESKGYRISIAENGQDALNQAAQTRPDLMILDVGLPEGYFQRRLPAPCCRRPSGGRNPLRGFQPQPRPPLETPPPVE